MSTDTTVGAAALFDPFHPDVRRDPYPVYARFRDSDPVHRGAPPLASLPECDYVFRYEDVDSVLRDPRFGRAPGADAEAAGSEGSVALRRIARRMLLFKDPPAHQRLRSLLTRAFAPFLTEDLEERVGRVAQRLLDRPEREGGFDLMSDFAVPLPVLVIADLMGIPEGDRSRFQRLSDAVMAMSDLRRNGAVVKDATKAALELSKYLEGIIEERSRRPTDDLISRLLEVEEDGEGLSGDDVLANCALLLIAGHETTRNLIGNGVLALLEHPQELERLRANPELMDGAVHELLRYDSPIQITFRRAKEDVELRGREIRAGQGAALVLGSANRDPEAFPTPDLIDLERPSRRHLAFGGGPHVCLGSRLAVLDAKCAIGALIDRFAVVERTEAGPPERSEQVVFRGLKRLPLRVARLAEAPAGGS